MLTSDFYDIETEALVSLEAFYGPKRQLVDKCLIIFSKTLHTYLLDNYACERIAELGACNGNIPVYCLEYKGERIAFYLTAIGSAMAASLCCEANWLTGASRFVMFGSCGSLDGAKTKGRFIVPTEAYRGEGASHYFAPSADYITVRNAERVAAALERLRAPYVRGRVWTTDSMLRETKGLVGKRRSEGCIAVEMELAGVQAACDFYGMELYDFLESGDVLSESGYEPEGLREANHSIGKLLLGLEIAAQL